MKQLTNITKALADETRIRILAALENQELCVCQITELLQLAPSTISKHLFLLKQAGFVESRKDKRWIYYRLADKDSPRIVQEWLKLLLASTVREKSCMEDKKTLKAILKIDVEEICCKQRAMCGA